MNNSDITIRDYLSPNAQVHFDDIVTQRVLGASAHIKMISQMIEDLCITAKSKNESSACLHEKIHQLANYFIKTRGEASQAITNAIVMMTNGIDELTDHNVDSYTDFIQQKMNDFEVRNQKNLALINQYASSILTNMNSVLLFDYSSTVGKMIETCDHPLEIFIAESRAFDGGKPYIPQAIKGHHEIHFIPDVAIFYYLKKCDGVFIGAETFTPDGKVYNTIGTEMVAHLCNTLEVPFYILTTLVKIDMRSVYGYNKQLPTLDLRERILANIDDATKHQIDVSCPEVVEIPSKWITAFITEVGIVPPSAIYQLSTTYLKENGVIIKHA